MAYYYRYDEPEPDPNIGKVDDYTLEVDGDMLVVKSGDETWQRELPDLAKARLVKESLGHLSAHEKIIVVRAYQRQHRKVILHFEDGSVNFLVGLVKQPQ